MDQGPATECDLNGLNDLKDQTLEQENQEYVPNPNKFEGANIYFISTNDGNKKLQKQEFDEKTDFIIY